MYPSDDSPQATAGGALFGDRILFLFVVISLLKWGLVLFLIAAVCLPIWVSFHSAVLGNLTAWMTGTRGILGGGIDYVYGAAILTPANLFTGVLGCGWFCLLNLWMDRRFLPKALRLPWWLWLLNLVSGVVFLGLGLKGYWDDQSRWRSTGLGSASCGSETGWRATRCLPT